MHVEVSVALNFVMTYLYNKLPRRRVDMFGDELEKALKKKFEGHWYPETPFKGSAFRCCRLTGEQTDPVMDVAALASGLDVEEIKEYLPDDLVVWIDPCEVSYRIGEKGVVKVLYSTREEASSLMGLDREVQAASKGFNPEAQCFKPIDSLSSSLSNLSLSPSSPPNAVSPLGVPSYSSASPLAYMGRQPATPMMTTAMFAQTKFGSTKLKTQVKRPARLSPTELGVYLTQRHMLPPPPASFPILPPQVMRPREPRRDILDQQRLLFAQHYGNPSLMNSLGNSPLGGSLNDLYGQPQQPTPSMAPSFPDVRPPAVPRGPLQEGPSSPEANQALLDALNMGTLPPYASLQHLLVAN